MSVATKTAVRHAPAVSVRRETRDLVEELVSFRRDPAHTDPDQCDAVETRPEGLEGVVRSPDRIT